MERLRAMREPLKYVQGRDALLQFQKEMEYMGHRWLFICSRSGYQ
ncbi:MAG: glycerol dehydrogenase, partial [Blautia wexlerae]|nr:glycerol dehydrogenase [Blautia wexlerae]